MPRESSPEFAGEYFDPKLNRIISLDEAWQQTKHGAFCCANDAEKRLYDVKELQSAVRDQLMMLDVRETSVRTTIATHARALIQQIRDREQELQTMLANDCFLQRQQLTTTMQELELAERKISRTSSKLLDVSLDFKDRFAALWECERALHETRFFAVDEPFVYDVSATPLVVERHLNMTRERTPLHLPTALTLPVMATERVELPFPTALYEDSFSGASSPQSEFISAPLLRHLGLEPSLSSEARAESTSGPRHASATRPGFDRPPTARGEGAGTELTPSSHRALRTKKQVAVKTSHVPKGILYYLATAGDTKLFSNPIESGSLRGWCTIKTALGDVSSLCNAIRPDLNEVNVCDLLSRGAASSTDAEALAERVEDACAFRTVSEPKGQIIFDFGDRRRVRLSGYALRHGHRDLHVALRSWAVKGSLDEKEWFVLDSRQNNPLLGAHPLNTAVFPIDEEGFREQLASAHLPRSADAFRFICIEATGENVFGKHHIELSGVELYGVLESSRGASSRNLAPTPSVPAIMDNK